MSQGGQGGDASVDGDNSFALGGDAGDAVIEPGGRGGHARIKGNFSFAKGGKGGRGGIISGMPGGDAFAKTDNVCTIGGQGGEAPQADGRGGRGGLPGLLHLNRSVGSRRQMLLHWDEKNNEPGRGGDGAMIVQYKARRIILENLKLDYFSSAKINIDNSNYDIWYDRDIVSLEWLNLNLKIDRHQWTVLIKDDEYEFVDNNK